MIQKKDVQKAAKKVAKTVAKKSGEAYDAVEKAARPTIKKIKKAAAPKIKEARKAIDKQVAKGVKGAKSITIATNMAGRGTDILLGGNPEAMAKDALNSSARSLKKAAKKI